MSARVGTGGTSLRHRSEMLGRVYREAKVIKKQLTEIMRRLSKTAKHMGGGAPNSVLGTRMASWKQSE